MCANAGTAALLSERASTLNQVAGDWPPPAPPGVNMVYNSGYVLLLLPSRSVWND